MSWLFKFSMLLFAFIFGGVAAIAQTKTVTGTVIDDFGEPVLGANVVVVGTTNGATTDLDGNFSLSNVPNDGKLKVTFIGYTPQEVSVAGQTKLNITLKEDVAQLEDVVVVGYGVMKKTDLTGSVASVNTEKLNQKGAPSMMENLQGSTPGVNITMAGGRTGGTPSIEIRGKSSINSSVTPLYVVDGVMCDDIDWLNPQDIDRVDILKDASSTAIYGSRATAGVVMVSTKSGSNAKKGDKATISYDGYYGMSKVARMPEFMNGQEFYDYRFLKFTAPAISNAQAMFNPAQPVYGFGAASTLEQCLLAYKQGENSFALKKMLANGETNDWADLVTRDGSQQNHYVAVSGTSEKVNYHVGVGYNEESGIYEKDSQRRLNFKASVDAKVNKFVSTGFNINLARQVNKYANDEAVQFAYRMNPFMIPYDENGVATIKSGNSSVLGTDPAYQFSDQVSPLKYMDNSKRQRENWRVLGNFYVQLDLMKGLFVKSTFSPNFQYYREGYINGIKDPNNPGYTFANKDYNDEAEAWNEIKQTTNRGISYTWDNVINYMKDWGKHSITAMGLFSFEQSNTEKVVWDANNTQMDGSDWWNMSAATFNQQNSSSMYSEYSMLSYALRLNYNYAGKYMATVTSRWDGSSRFADGNRWGCFPSAALAWRITGEDFMQPTEEWLSNLKLRLSYGVTGNNDGIGNYATQTTPSAYSFYPFGSSYNNAYVASGIVDRDLQWEISKEFNVGLDFGFFNNRINGTIDWYNKESEDLLYEVQLPLEAGLDADGKAMKLKTNIGSVRNRGIEVGLTTVNIDTKNWTWSTTFNFSRNENEVLEINGTGDRALSGSNGNVTGSYFIGSSANVLWSYRTDGIVSDKMMTVPNNEAAKKAGLTPGQKMRECDYYYAAYGWCEGQPIIRDVNGDGKFDADNDRVLTSADPKWTGSFSSNLSYKNWDLSLSVYAKIGQYSYSNFLGEYLNWGDRGRQKLSVDYYIPAGTLVDCDGMNPDGSYVNPVFQEKTHYGSYPFPNNGNGNGVGVNKPEWDEAKMIVKSSFAKVKNISVGYTFDKKLLKPWGCSSLRVYATVTNPFVFTDYKGFDPEWAGSSLKNDGPSTITYQLGASIKF